MDDHPSGRGDGPPERFITLKQLVGLILLFGAGLALGFYMDSEGGASSAPSPPLPAPTVTRTVEVEKTKEVRVEVPKIPAACADAVKMSDALWASVSKYEVHLGVHQTLLTEAQAAVALGSTEALLKSDADLRKLKGVTLDDLLAMRNTIQQYKAARERCLKEIG